MREYVSDLQDNNFFVPFVALVETWLCPEVDDAQINITGFNVFRQDRRMKKHGGVLLYVNKKIVIDSFELFDDGQCCAIICLSKLSKCFISCIYRPPNSTLPSFDSMLTFISNFVTLHNPINKFHLHLFGDFNLPGFCWEKTQVVNSFSQNPLHNKLTQFMTTHFLSQYV